MIWSHSLVLYTCFWRITTLFITSILPIWKHFRNGGQSNKSYIYFNISVSTRCTSGSRKQMFSIYFERWLIIRTTLENTNPLKKYKSGTHNFSGATIRYRMFPKSSGFQIINSSVHFYKKRNNAAYINTHYHKNIGLVYSWLSNKEGTWGVCCVSVFCLSQCMNMKYHWY